MSREVIERVAVLENQVATINQRGIEILADGKATKATVDEIKLLIAKGQGAWWAGRSLGAVILTLWTALVGAASSLWMAMPKIH